MKDTAKLTRQALAQAAYLDFGTYCDRLSAADRARLSNTQLLFCYPVLCDNEFEMVEHPVSQRILIATTQYVGCRVLSEVALVGSGAIRLSPVSQADPDFVIIHPMIGVIEHLYELAGSYRTRYPNTSIVLHNSDHNQHEKILGGPKGREIARQLLVEIPTVDFVLLGFAEHALLELILGRPTAAVVARTHTGVECPGLFYLASLPEAVTSADTVKSTRSLRVQRSRGCLGPCTYCIEGQANRTLNGERPWDGIPTEVFVDRLAEKAELGFFFINVTDSSFEDPGPRGLKELHTFCRLIIERGIRLSFKIHLRAENVLKTDDAELDSWKTAGVDVIVCGLESGSQVELDFYRKIASKEVNRAAFLKLEEPRMFCNILGYMMFSPICTVELLCEKVEFLREIDRGWDFLNLTNRLLVFSGTVVHEQLLEAGLIDAEYTRLGYVPYRFKDSRVEYLDRIFNRLKRDRPGFMKLNNLIYDSMNLESRMLNPANVRYRDEVGEAFEVFRSKLSDRKKRLTELYCDGFLEVLGDPSLPFLPAYNVESELRRQRCELETFLAFVRNSPDPPDTLYLHTWLSVVNRFGISEKA